MMDTASTPTRFLAPDGPLPPGLGPAIRRYDAAHQAGFAAIARQLEAMEARDVVLASRWREAQSRIRAEWDAAEEDLLALMEGLDLHHAVHCAGKYWLMVGGELCCIDPEGCFEVP